VAGEAPVDLFVCYARRDLDYVQALVDAVRAAGLVLWVDLSGIPPADPDWAATVNGAIVTSPAFLLVLSLSSAESDQCRRETALAVEHGKQLVVVRHGPVRPARLVPAVARSNWVPGDSVEDVPVTAVAVVRAFLTDLAWKRHRADVELAATRWRDADRDPSHLLRGRVLDDAERQMAGRAANPLPPTALHQEFVAAGRAAADEAARRRADAGRVAQAGELLDRDPTGAARLLLELADPDGTQLALQRMNEVSRRWLVQHEFRYDESVQDVDSSRDGALLASASADGTARVWPVCGTTEPVLLPLVNQGFLVRFSPDGTRVVTAANDDTAKVWPVDGSSLPVVVERRGGIPHWSPAGDLLAIVTDEGSASLYSPDGAPQERLDPDVPFVLELDDSGWPTGPAWLYRREASGAAPGAVLVGPPSWFRPRDRPSPFSPDGTRIAAGSLDGTARVWPVGGGAPVELHHDDAVLSATFSPTGDRLLTASYDGTARVWQPDTPGPAVHVLRVGSPVIVARFDPTGTRVVTASVDGMARLWELERDSLPVELPHGSPVYSAAFSPDATTLLTEAVDAVARLWWVDSRPRQPPATARALPQQPTAVFRGDRRLTTTKLTPSGGIVTAAEDGQVRVWCCPNPQLRHGSPGTDVRFGPDGRTLAAVAADHTVRAWRLSDARRTVLIRHDARVHVVAHDQTGDHLVTASADGTAHVALVDGRRPPLVLPHPAEVTRATFSPNGTQVVTGAADGLVRVWPVDGTSGPVVLGPAGSYKGVPQVTAVAVSPDGSRVLAASGPFARVWPTHGGSPMIRLLGQHGGGYIEQLERAWFNRDGARIVTMLTDGTVRHWPADGHGDPTELPRGAHVMVADDATWVITVSPGDLGARRWQIADTPDPQVIAQVGQVRIAAASPDGQTLAVADPDGVVSVRRFDRAGDPVVHVPGRPVAALAVSADGQHVATTADDGNAQVWYADRPDDPLTLQHDGPVRAVDFSANSRRIATASDDGTTRIWWLAGHDLRAQLAGATSTSH
jgi:WD40 repeat protein